VSSCGKDYTNKIKKQIYLHIQNSLLFFAMFKQQTKMKLLIDTAAEIADESVKIVRLRHTRYGNYCAYVGRVRVMEDSSATSLKQRVEIKYPNATIIIK
jgi:hypothetical protein